MDPTIWEMAKPIIAGQLRHALTGVAGVLITKGALEGSQSDAFVSIGLGLASYAAGAGWSWWQKSGQAMVTAQLGRLKSRVAAIPSALPTAPVSAAAAIEAAKQVAAEPK